MWRDYNAKKERKKNAKRQTQNGVWDEIKTSEKKLMQMKNEEKIKTEQRCFVYRYNINVL